MHDATLPSGIMVKTQPTPGNTEAAFSAPQWSTWSRCESSFSMLLVPHRPGVLAVAEEVLEDAATGRRVLALFHVAEARDLSFAVSDLFTAANPFRERLAEGRCLLRYAMISDPEHRAGVLYTLQSWMTANAQQASGIAASPAVNDDLICDCDPADCTRATPSAQAAQPVAASKSTAIIRPVFPAGF
jgi:hypothetical protein